MADEGMDFAVPPPVILTQSFHNVELRDLPTRAATIDEAKGDACHACSKSTRLTRELLDDVTKLVVNAELVCSGTAPPVPVNALQRV